MILDPLVCSSVRALIEKEARLLDRLLFEDWLKMYVDECAYWVPATPNGGDPRTEIAICFDDRRRLEDRIYRLRTNFAWSQRPSSRTARIVSGITVYDTDARDTFLVRLTLYTSELHDGDWRKYRGWYGHLLCQFDEKLMIKVKQVNLIDCDQNLRNLSTIL